MQITKLIEVILKGVYGNSDYDLEAGCYSHGNWFSINDVIRHLENDGINDAASTDISDAKWIVENYVESLDDDEFITECRRYDIESKCKFDEDDELENRYDVQDELVEAILED